MKNNSLMYCNETLQSNDNSIVETTTNQCCKDSPRYKISISFPGESSSYRFFCQTHKNILENLAKMAKIEPKITEVCA